MSRRSLSVGIACAATALAALLITPAAPAAAANPKIMITKVYYDTPGTDTPATNTRLNGEYVVLKNTTSAKINLKGWTLRDVQSTASGHIYRFGSDFWLGAGKSVTIHTGKGTNTSTNRYWGRTGSSSYAYIWNNSGDKAYLRNSAGTAIDSCGWSSVGSGYTYC